ncbi:NAD(+) synthase [Mycoplasmopsis adleri]|uniref:NAD(+) synthase n=1 Tax=Mycoplasmopsis adleri TaxID=51362 RepID=UPI003872F158
MKNKERKGLRYQNDLNSPFDENKVEEYANYLVNWIKEKTLAAKCKGCVVGISGGIDSALVCALSKKAFPNNTLGIVMPIDNMSHDANDINLLSGALDLEFKEVNLKNTFLEIQKACDDEITNLMSLSNIKPRLRMTTLYAYAQQNNYLVLGTDNEDEYFIGYFTKYGDGGVDLLPISQLLKSEVRALAKHLNIPQSIINKTPSAGLWDGQSDEKELGFSYDDLDNYLINNTSEIDKDKLAKIKRMHSISKHKRLSPPKPLSIEKYFKSN